MKKETKITILLGFIAILTGLMVFTHINRVLCKKDVEGTYKNRELFDKPKDEYDVILLGSSHIGVIQPQYLWENYGITSYNLYCTGEGILRSKAMLEMALDHIQPKLVVLETEKYWDVPVYDESTVNLHSTYDQFPLSSTKIKSVLEVVPFPDIRKELIFPLIKYHTRYTKLRIEDFVVPMDDSLGAALHFESVPQEYHDMIPRGQRPAELEEGIEEGLNDISRIVELCRDRGIDIMFVCLPLSAKEHFQEKMHLLYDLAEKYGVFYYNFMDHEPVINIACDLRDPGHMNLMGAQKAADVLVDQIRANFDIRDHRDEPELAQRWNARIPYYNNHLFEIASNPGEIDTFSEALVLMGLPQFCGEVYVRNSETGILKSEGVADLFESIAGRELPVFKEAVQDRADYLFIFNRRSGSIQEYTGDAIDEIFNYNTPPENVFISLRNAGSEDLECIAEIKN